jgi:hypothetical protein
LAGKGPDQKNPGLSLSLIFVIRAYEADADSNSREWGPGAEPERVLAMLQKYSQLTSAAQESRIKRLGCSPASGDTVAHWITICTSCSILLTAAAQFEFWISLMAVVIPKAGAFQPAGSLSLISWLGDPSSA